MDGLASLCCLKDGGESVSQECSVGLEWHVRVVVCACMCQFVRVRACVCMSACLCVRMRACAYACVRVYVCVRGSQPSQEVLSVSGQKF